MTDDVCADAPSVRPCPSEDENGREKRKRTRTGEQRKDEKKLTKTTQKTTASASISRVLAQHKDQKARGGRTNEKGSKKMDV
jgi:hypothetical protein